MFLFLMGVSLDLPTILLLSLFIFLIGLLSFYSSRAVLRKYSKNSSQKRINFLARLSTVILTPLIFSLLAFLIIYSLSKMAPEESEEDLIKGHYKSMEEELSRDIIIGMSKMEVVELFGERDTTKSVWNYDLSVHNAKEKYILEVKFENGKLVSYERKN